MKKTTLSLLGLAFSILLVLNSCSPDPQVADETVYEVAKAQASVGKNDTGLPMLSSKTKLPVDKLFRDFPFDLEKAVEPSECGPTEFDDVINESIDSNLDALGAEWYGLYAEMNFLYTITDESRQYFGEHGQYTHYFYWEKRNLERFWDMPNEVTVRGQHNRTLDNKDKIIDILTFWYGLSVEEAQMYADFFVDEINEESTFLTETPLLSFDGFAIALDGLFDQGDLIVIGDGLIELASKTGVNHKTVISGIMAHEWGHQIQFNNFDDWYPNGAADNEPEATRTTELEADFFTGYALTHRKCKGFSWKKTHDLLELFFNIGDCAFDNPGHHGTPLQRMEAARQGYLLALKTKWRRSNLDAQDVHEVFIEKLPEIVAVGETEDPYLQ